MNVKSSDSILAYRKGFLSATWALTMAVLVFLTKDYPVLLFLGVAIVCVFLAIVYTRKIIYHYKGWQLLRFDFTLTVAIVEWLLAICIVVGYKYFATYPDVSFGVYLIIASATRFTDIISNKIILRCGIQKFCLLGPICVSVFGLMMIAYPSSNSIHDRFMVIEAGLLLCAALELAGAYLEYMRVKIEK